MKIQRFPTKVQRTKNKVKCKKPKQGRNCILDHSEWAYTGRWCYEAKWCVNSA